MTKTKTKTKQNARAGSPSRSYGTDPQLRVHIGSFNLGTRIPRSKYDLSVWLEDFLWFGNESLFDLVSGARNPPMLVTDSEGDLHAHTDTTANEDDVSEDNDPRNPDKPTEPTSNFDDVVSRTGRSMEQKRNVHSGGKNRGFRKRGHAHGESHELVDEFKPTFTMSSRLSEILALETSTPFDCKSPYSNAALGAIQGVNAPQIYFFGFQELASQPNLFTYSQPLYDIWVPSLMNRLDLMHTRRSYRCVAQRQMVAIGGCLIASSEVKVHDVYVGELGSGFLGVYGNKGCVAIGIDFEYEGKEGSMVFVGLHMKAFAGEKYYLHRKHEFDYLISSVVLTSEDDPDVTRRVSDFDSLFVCGDTNFRLFCSGKWKDPNFVRDSLKEQLLHKDLEADDTLPSDLSHLFDGNDELDHLLGEDTTISSERTLLPLFKEPKLTHIPSYKYHVGTCIFNTKRDPAWPDRVFYTTTPNQPILNCGYRSVECSLSDHLPVVASFKMKWDKKSESMSTYPTISASGEADTRFDKDESNEESKLLEKSQLDNVLKNMKTKSKEGYNMDLLSTTIDSTSCVFNNVSRMCKESGDCKTAELYPNWTYSKERSLGDIVANFITCLVNTIFGSFVPRETSFRDFKSQNVGEIEDQELNIIYKKHNLLRQRVRSFTRAVSCIARNVLSKNGFLVLLATTTATGIIYNRFFLASLFF